MQLIRAIQPFDIYQVFIPPDAIPHTHEYIRASQERTRLSRVLG